MMHAHRRRQVFGLYSYDEAGLGKKASPSGDEPHTLWGTLSVCCRATRSYGGFKSSQPLHSHRRQRRGHDNRWMERPSVVCGHRTERRDAEALESGSLLPRHLCPAPSTMLLPINPVGPWF